MKGQNLIEKIAQRFAFGLQEGEVVHSGDYISIRPAYLMTHDNTSAVISKFKSIGAKKMADPRQMVFTLDHEIQNTTRENLEKYAKIEKFAQEMGVDFYPAGRGIGHQVMCEEGYVWPGTMVVASDSHSNIYGGLGCLGTPIVRTDAAAIWATGRTWWQVPPVAKVVLHGKLQPKVTGKDVILTLCGLFKDDEVLNHAIEFAGEGIPYLSVDQRLSIANMTTEWGALAGVFPADLRTIEWLERRARIVAQRGVEHPRLNTARINSLKSGVLEPDRDVYYAKVIHLDISSVRPQGSGPYHVHLMNSAMELSRRDIRIHKAYLLSCVNGRVEDLAEAALVVRGKKVAPHVKFYIAAASSEVQKESEERGDWQVLLDADAIPLPPGCGPCIGMGEGLLADGEVGISATNRNFKGRMGSPNAEVYLASPAVVAASAIAGKIACPQEFNETPPSGEIKIVPRPAAPEVEIPILQGFPEMLEGEVVFCHEDNLNTDGIYPGKYTYKDLPPEEMARVVMENYDPQFTKLVAQGDILAGGYNFGTGSSREQAATALKYRGIALLIAGSFNETYKRNAINNGFLAIEAPEFVTALKQEFGPEKLTIRTGVKVRVNFRRSVVTARGKDYPIGPVGTAAQELMLAGGLEAWVKKRLEG